MKLAAPPGLSSVLSAISCPTASFCLAANGSSAADWNGRRWTWTGPVAQTVRRNEPLGTIGNLSCASATSCLALGQPDIFGEFWNGKSWRNAPIAVPKGKHVLVDLTSLSCVQAETKGGTSCLAVGSWGADFGQGPGGSLAEAWSGGKWRILPSPGHTDGADWLTAVSCRTGPSCMAIGAKRAGGLFLKLLAARWDGQRWSVTDLPGKYANIQWSGAAEGPSSLSCPTSTRCVAVGSYFRGSKQQFAQVDISLIWNGHAWRIVRPGGPAGLVTVSCSSASQCVAIGQPGTATLAKLWNGRAWKVIKTINP
jgi:hypothetical protein